jgi:hypothetical protein
MATQFAAQAITITASTLATGAARESAAVTTDTTLNVNDYRVFVKPTNDATGPSGSKAVFVWVAISDDGTNWTGNATGLDAAITLDSPHQFQLGVAISFPSASIARGGSFSLKAACGGSLPKAWSIIIENRIGGAFTALTVAAQKEYNS